MAIPRSTDALENQKFVETSTTGQPGVVVVNADGTDVNGYVPGAEDNTNNVIAVVQRPLAVSTYGWTLFSDLGANATANVKASAGNVFSIYCHNLNAAVRYIQLHNTATTPAGGAVPTLSFLVAASGVTVIDGAFLGQSGKNFSTGIAFAFSTTETTYTAGTAGDQVTFIHYK